MKRSLLILPVVLLLASCNASHNLSGEVSITAEQGQAKYSAINGDESLLSSLGSKCIVSSTNTSFADIDMSDSTYSMKVSMAANGETRVDVHNNVSYEKAYILMSVSMTLEGQGRNDPVSLEMDIETWKFDRKAATKMLVESDGESSTTYMITEDASSAQEKALDAIEEAFSSLDGITWESMEYFGNDKEKDLRIAGKNGADESGTVIDSLDMTFVDGLPTYMSTVQDLPIGEYGNTSTVATMEFSYPDNLSIDTPDLSSAEWSSSSSDSSIA